MTHSSASACCLSFLWLGLVTAGCTGLEKIPQSTQPNPESDEASDDETPDGDDNPDAHEESDSSDDDSPPADTDDPDADDDTDDETDTPYDAAEVVAVDFPADIPCGETATASVEMRNIGRATWNRDEGYKLGIIDDDDDLYGPDTRVWLPEGTEIAPGDTWSFTFEMSAPETEGLYISDWQMVHEYVGWFGDEVDAEINVACDDSSDSGDWIIEACARNGDEICDDEMFDVEPGHRYGLKCRGPEGGIGFISSNTGPEMSDGMERCQGWEERGEDAWDSLAYVHSFVCSSEGVVEVDVSAWSGAHLWFGSHDHPDGGGHMTDICLVSQPE